MGEKYRSLFRNGKKKKLFYIACSILLLIIIPLLLNQSKTKKNQATYHVYHSKTTFIPGRKDNRIEGQITVKVKPQVTDQQIQQLLQKYDAKIISQIPTIHWLVIQVPKEQTDEVLKQLSKENLIEKAESDYKIHGTSVLNDPMYTKQYYLKNTGQNIDDVDGKSIKGKPKADINIETAWNVTKGNGIKVGVVDSGINLTHEDLQNKVIAQKSFVQGDNSIEDGAGHGTVTAGILAANANNGVGIAGVCPGCKLIVARSTDNDANGSTSAIAEGIMYAVDQGAQIINMSVGGEAPEQILEDAVKYARQKGVILVAAAGNCADSDYQDNYCTSQNPLFYPAAYDGVISVTATDNTDQRYIKASYGTWVKIAAPGSGIFSTLPNHKHTQTQTLNYDFYYGTSQAAPQVSGVLALLLSTGLSPATAVQKMYATADKIDGTGTLWQYGRLNAGKALAAIPTPKPVLPTTAQQPTTPPPTQQPQPTQEPSDGEQQQPNPTCTFATLGGQPCITPSIKPTIVEQPIAPQQPGSTGNSSTPNTNANAGLLQTLILLIQFIISVLKQSAN